jgi:transposase
LTDEEWALVEPLMPPARRDGNRLHVVVREVINGLMYILSTGCQRRAIPKDLPPRSTLYDCFDLWGWDGTLDRIHDGLYAQCRQAASREASPTAAIIDSQSVKIAEKGGLQRATTRARRSRARSGTSSSIRRPVDARHRARRRRLGSRRRGDADGELVRRTLTRHVVSLASSSFDLLPRQDRLSIARSGTVKSRS